MVFHIQTSENSGLLSKGQNSGHIIAVSGCLVVNGTEKGVALTLQASQAGEAFEPLYPTATNVIVRDRNSDRGWTTTVVDLIDRLFPTPLRFTSW